MPDQDSELKQMMDELSEAMKTMMPSFQALLVKQEQSLQKRIAEHGPRNGWFKDFLVESFIQDGHECWICKDAELWKEFDECFPDQPPKVGYTGYVTFKEKPLVEPGYKGILAYVPVHGGITYCCHDELGSVYGFDTNHGTSPKYPIRDIAWIKEEISVMARGIIYAASIEEAYLKADGNNKLRAELLQPLVDLRPTDMNFSVMLNLLSGEL
jgi:hypothetical protein